MSALRAGPPIDEVRVNPTTASVLIVGAPGVPFGAVLEHAAGQGLFQLKQDGPMMVESVLEGAHRMDGGIRLMSGNQLDLRALTFILFLGGAFYQVVRGNWLAPAATLGWYAAAVYATGFGSRRGVVT